MCKRYITPHNYIILKATFSMTILQSICEVVKVNILFPGPVDFVYPDLYNK